MVVIATHQSRLEELGLHTLERTKAFQGELVKNHRGRRDIFRIKATADDGRPLVLFLKRNWNPYKKDGLESLLRRGSVWSLSRQEWENSRKLEAAGIRTAALVAYGEECGPLWEKFSYIITEAAAGAQTLDQFLSECHDAVRRRRVFDALAGQVRKLHEAGLATPDLFARHIFVDAEAEPPQFCLIDMARVDAARPLPARLRVRDLAALNITAPVRFVSARERLRFLRAYAGGVDRGLVKQIAGRVQHLLRRRKFRDFLQREQDQAPLP